MLKIAITGNIASGKSAVENHLQKLGYKVFDTDKITHQILETTPEVKKTFGTTDRKEIAKIVFSNPEKLKVLETIIHPKVKEEILKIFKLDEKIVFISVPQLFESGFNNLFDKVIFISANENIRLERLMKRNNFSEEEALKRISAQIKEEEKIPKCDFVIQNNSDIQHLEAEINKTLSTIAY